VTAIAKEALRVDLLAARRAMDPAERERADAALVAHVVEVARGRDVVAAYSPIRNEPGGAGLLAALYALVRVVLLPVLRPDGDLDWAAYTGILAEPGRGGFRPPSGDPLGVDAIATADLVLVPAVAVSTDGSRLGRGRGGYDRALARISPGTPVVALLYRGEFGHAVPTEPHDRPVTSVLLPTGPERLRGRPNT
jgi:5-formyltetrahydrofolate cyclo-ligase